MMETKQQRIFPATFEIHNTLNDSISEMTTGENYSSDTRFILKRRGRLIYYAIGNSGYICGSLRFRPLEGRYYTRKDDLVFPLQLEVSLTDTGPFTEEDLENAFLSTGVAKWQNPKEHYEGNFLRDGYTNTEAVISEINQDRLRILKNSKLD